MKRIAIVGETSNSVSLEKAVNNRLKMIGSPPEKIVYLTDASGKITNVVIEFDAA